MADSVGLQPLKAARLRADAKLNATSSMLQQVLEQLPLSALKSRAEAAGWWPEDLAAAGSKEEERLELISALMESELMTESYLRLDDVSTALSNVVDGSLRSCAKDLCPEAYVGPTTGKLGGEADGEHGVYNLLDAMSRCTALTWAVGFCFLGPPEPSPMDKLDCAFFRTVRCSGVGDERWTSYIKQVDCTSMDVWASERKATERAKLKKQRHKAARKQQRQQQQQQHS